jgi:hypothetical protein
MWAYLEIAGLTILIKIASSAERQNRTIRRSYGADSLSDLSAPRALVALTRGKMKGSPLVNGLLLVVLERWRMLNYEWTFHRILAVAINPFVKYQSCG